ncbi:recombinase family protein [Streptomyces prasinus]|uniref:Resolvase/invertase-type recombinase catalytic domain-containing protein n=1 Tax=Streptomyces prasinus TaxID=67345 RepID=A0ABX6AYH0_9ACTN|nr:recombinase family protein [Streptomyces prasinus]QEV06975.1 hypothetical protein CP972_16170 [Streptomyces prasinus]
MVVAFAELERGVIVERTRAGLDAAKAQGCTGGRPTVIAKALGVSRVTLHRHIGWPLRFPDHFEPLPTQAGARPRFKAC